MNLVKDYNSSTWERVLLYLGRQNIELGEYLITAVANNGHLEFVLNLVANLNVMGYKKYLIVCLDMVLYENLIRYGLVSVVMGK